MFCCKTNFATQAEKLSEPIPNEDYTHIPVTQLGKSNKRAYLTSLALILRVKFSGISLVYNYAEHRYHKPYYSNASLAITHILCSWINLQN